MKNLLVAMFFLATTMALNAQISGSTQRIDASAVPQEVLNAQANYFPGSIVNVWEKQSASGKNNSGYRYVATFKNNSQSTRARYYADGTGATATSYYAAASLPQAIKDAASANYPNYRLNSGEQVYVLAADQTYFRLRLRKGAQKLVVYVDETGKEIAPNQLPEEVTEE